MIRQNGLVIMTEDEYNRVPGTLREIATQIGGLSECGGIRQYFDGERKDVCTYDSYIIHNYFALCEEICGYISKREYETAEQMIKDYIKNEEHSAEDSYYKREYKELVKFLPKILARESKNTDIQLNRKDFVKLYKYAKEQMDIVELDEQDSHAEVLVYGNECTVHYLGYYCSCGDGAAIYNYIIEAIEGLNEEEDDDYEKENM